MPELPEVETVVRTVAPRLIGRRLVEVRCFAHKKWALTLDKASGQKIRTVRRYGKYILLELHNGLLAIHLGMTGRPLTGGEKGRYTRAMLACDRGTVLFDDVRQFGSVRWLASEPERLGHDALEISADEFLGRLRMHKGHLKALLIFLPHTALASHMNPSITVALKIILRRLSRTMTTVSPPSMASSGLM